MVDSQIEMPMHVVVDGSNLATEGRTLPSLQQLIEGVIDFRTENPDAEVVVVVDATFGAPDDSRFIVFSATKAFVAAAFWQLIDRGDVDVMAPVATYLDAFTTNGQEEVTVEQVLTHTGGFPFAPPGPPTRVTGCGGDRPPPPVQYQTQAGAPRHGRGRVAEAQGPARGLHRTALPATPARSGRRAFRGARLRRDNPWQR